MKIVLASRQTLWHVTGIWSAVSILQQGFVLKPAEGSEWEEVIDRNKPAFYLSTARYLKSDYILGNLGSFSCVIELDGDAIATRYSIAPVDYWSAKQHRNEAEERIFSRNPVLPQKYIRSIRAVVSEDPRFEILRRACVKAKVVLKAFATREDLLNARATPIAAPKRSLSPFKPFSAVEKKRAFVRYGQPYLAGYIELYKRPIPSDVAGRRSALKANPLSERGKYALERLPYAKYDRTAVSTFKADLHNAKAYQLGDGGRNREALHKIVEILRKQKWTAESFLQHLAMKWGAWRT